MTDRPRNDAPQATNARHGGAQRWCLRCLLACQPLCVRLCRPEPDGSDTARASVQQCFLRSLSLPSPPCLIERAASIGQKSSFHQLHAQDITCRQSIPVARRRAWGEWGRSGDGLQAGRHMVGTLLNPLHPSYPPHSMWPSEGAHEPWTEMVHALIPGR